MINLGILVLDIPASTAGLNNPRNLWPRPTNGRDSGERSGAAIPNVIETSSM